MVKVYAYWLRATGQELKHWARVIGSPTCFWVASLADFQMGQGLPGDWLDQGSMFNTHGELRWWKEGEQYQTVLFSEQEVAGLQLLDGEWEAQDKDEEVFLQDLTEPRVRPTFDRYPHGATAGRLRARVYRRDGVTVWISPRTFA